MRWGNKPCPHLVEFCRTHMHIFLLKNNRQLLDDRKRHICFDRALQGRTRVSKRLQNVSVWLTGRGGPIMHALASVTAGTFSLGFTRSIAESAAVSRTTHGIKQTFVLWHLLWPCHPQDLTGKLCCRLPVPLCDLPYHLAVFTAVMHSFLTWSNSLLGKACSWPAT